MMDGEGLATTTIEKSKIWSGALQKTLTQEQLNLLHKVEAERSKFKRAAAVDGFIARADSKLLLSKEQRTKLTKFIDKKYGAKLAITLGKESVPQRIVFGGFNRRRGSEFAVKQLLSEDQYKIWKSEVVPELDGL